MDEQQKKELLRLQTLAYLVGTHPLSFSLDDLMTLVGDKLGATKDELKSAVDLLEGDGLIESARNPLGATIIYKATSDGVRFFERGKK